MSGTGCLGGLGRLGRSKLRGPQGTGAVLAGLGKPKPGALTAVLVKCGPPERVSSFIVHLGRRQATFERQVDRLGDLHILHRHPGQVSDGELIVR